MSSTQSVGRFYHQRPFLNLPNRLFSGRKKNDNMKFCTFLFRAITVPAAKTFLFYHHCGILKRQINGELFFWASNTEKKIFTKRAIPLTKSRMVFTSIKSSVGCSSGNLTDIVLTVQPIVLQTIFHTSGSSVKSNHEVI